jgi:UDP-N-acetylglucosamine 2-epimerase (hydrolysing)
MLESNKIKKILFITGTRADFGKLKPLMNVVEKSKNFVCDIFVTGMHTLELYGNTYHEIIKSGFENVHIYRNQFKEEPMETILGNTILSLSKFVQVNTPDMIIVHGDRIETLAGVIVGALRNILTCHIEGGELSGTIDESLRHSISKLAHLHLVANAEAKNRLIQMGENKNSIFILGSPDIDIMISSNLPTLEIVKNKYKINFNKFSIVLFHSVTTEPENQKQHAEELAQALIKSNKNYIVIFPNNDTGSHHIIDEYNKLKLLQNFKVFPSIRFEFFLTLLKNSSFIIGNSSAGIREAPIFGIPSINIGSRQKNRYQHSSIINTICTKNEILHGINKATKYKQFAPNMYFGNGKSSDLFLKILYDKNTWKTSKQKIFQEISWENHDSNNSSPRGFKRTSK